MVYLVGLSNGNEDFVSSTSIAKATEKATEIFSPCKIINIRKATDNELRIRNYKSNAKIAAQELYYRQSAQKEIDKLKVSGQNPDHVLCAINLIMHRERQIKFS